MSSRSRGAIWSRTPQATRAALAAGPEVVFQGAFLSGNWGGWSDFLERVERPSALGPFSYEVADTKLKRRPHPEACAATGALLRPADRDSGCRARVRPCRTGRRHRATLRLADYAAYARVARARLEGFVADPPPTRPIPCADCGLCRWADHCDERLAGRGQPVQRGQHQPRAGEEAGSGGHRDDGGPRQPRSPGARHGGKHARCVW